MKICKMCVHCPLLCMITHVSDECPPLPPPPGSKTDDVVYTLDWWSIFSPVCIYILDILPGYWIIWTGIDDHIAGPDVQSVQQENQQMAARRQGGGDSRGNSVS